MTPIEALLEIRKAIEELEPRSEEETILASLKFTNRVFDIMDKVDSQLPLVYRRV